MTSAPFRKISSDIDMSRIKEELHANPQLWDQFDVRRTSPGSPHSQMTDIWVRYCDPSGGTEAFNEPHMPVWYPSAHHLPSVRKLAVALTGFVAGEILGGILITRLPAGRSIARHTDSGWHAGYYDKFYVAINAPPGADFCFEYGSIQPTEGDVWWFRNDVPHWVTNGSDEDRLAAIICIRTDKFKD